MANKKITIGVESVSDGSIETFKVSPSLALKVVIPLIDRGEFVYVNGKEIIGKTEFVNVFLGRNKEYIMI